MRLARPPFIIDNQQHRIAGLWTDLPVDGGKFPEPARRRLLQGGNGSGKDHAAGRLRTLWQFFGMWLDWR